MNRISGIFLKRHKIFFNPDSSMFKRGGCGKLPDYTKVYNVENEKDEKIKDNGERK